MNRKPGNDPVQSVSAFDPRKNYEWPPTELFVITGAELELIVKALNAAADTAEFKKHVTIFNGLNASSKIFKEGIEQGLIIPTENITAE